MKIQFNAGEFAKGCDQASAALAANIEKAVELACIEVEREAKRLCPKGRASDRGKGGRGGKGGSAGGRDTVPLRQSIAYSIDARDGKARGVVGSHLEYAVYVHEGTGIHSRTGLGRKDVPWTYMDEETGDYYTTDGIEANPFLEKAAEKKQGRIAQIFGSILK